ncbi:MAG: cell division protein FtsA [Fretibacterium sp.]|nr:cell division protein FtsA [Fretibacterium sp.]
MQRESDTLVGLSVGTTKVTLIVAGRDPRYQDSVQVIGVGCSPSRGISKGVIVNLNEATESVLNAVRDAENIVGQRLTSAIVAFNSLDVNSVMTEGMVALGGREPSRVEISDLERVIEAAQSRLSPSKNTLSVHTIPVRYSLDDRPVDEPINMTGMRLEMALQTVSVPKTYVQNVITCVEGAGIQVEGLVLKPLASALGSLTQEEMRVGVVSLSIGGGSTGLVLYQAGRPFRILSVPIGGDHITNDLAGVLRIPLRRAEELKKRLFVDDEETLRREGVDVGLALEVLCSRVEELFVDHVREALRDCDPQIFPGGIVLSGGVAKTPGIGDMLSDILQMPVRIANPGDLYSMPPGREDSAYVSAAGLLRYILYRRRYTHLFIEPTPTEMRLSPRTIVKEVGEPYRVPAAAPRWNMKNMLEKLKENLKELF